jgi:hypothetical protein
MLPKDIFVSILIFVRLAHIIKGLGSLFAKLSPFSLFVLQPLSYLICLLLPFPQSLCYTLLLCQKLGLGSKDGIVTFLSSESF